MTINYAIGDSFLGPILVAMSTKGICAIELGNDPAEMLHNVKSELGATSQLVLAQSELQPIVEKVCSQISHPQKDLKLPLDIAGSKFQKLVWSELKKVKAGSTVSYSDLAKRLNSGPRAVGNACGANRVAVLIPCHRVIAKDGTLGGYRGGLAIKKKLLELEASLAKAK